MLNLDESENRVMTSLFLRQKIFLISPHYDLPTPKVSGQISTPALAQAY